MSTHAAVHSPVHSAVGGPLLTRPFRSVATL